VKLVLRIDDVGYTKTSNDGAFKTIEEGIATSADVMLDCPGTKDALKRLRNYPWISVGWHTHFWGRPVLPAEKVPSMVDENGNFNFHNKFRWDIPDMTENKNKIVYKEALAELRAEVELCIGMLGKAPDTYAIFRSAEPENEFDRALQDVCDEYGIQYNYSIDRGGEHCKEQYRDLGITWSLPSKQYGAMNDPELFREKLNYSPLNYFKDNAEELLKRKVVISPWHPGWIDDVVFYDSCEPLLMARIIDVHCLTSDEMKKWIIDNGVELVGLKDVLNGTNEYQNHLKEIGSPLYIK
jgi:predicted glycoside hydrolase/deacetylase ChbG (UPF0249 family)